MLQYPVGPDRLPRETGNLYPAVAVVGATASGKSRLALTVASEFGGEIISCDALQVYRYMDVGTAKPTPAEQAAIPHHMLDLRNPGEDFSAGDYQRLARQALGLVARHNRLPVVAGGTGFYLRSLIDGLSEGPARSETLRQRLRRIVGRKGPACLHRILARADPRSAARISPADAARLIRAVEVLWITGTPLSAWQEKPRDALTGFRWLKLGIAWPRRELYRRIDGRVEEMFAGGFPEEVRFLLSRFPRDAHAFKAIGYRQCAIYLDGTWTLEQAIEDTQRESRRYAKRQLTWFRRDPGIVWLDGTEDFASLSGRASELVRGFLAA
ncbi:MAG: tRNA (adenosine(37)-N6)-dimethylallyltransferase MiaA [Acidobacteria bacterium]|nr:tRNA (adenosine(37)-N6)-dimethylallyltransferase MiaA [Acidobacteriota bacterium]